jgi:hypothetical protein
LFAKPSVNVKIERLLNNPVAAMSMAAITENTSIASRPLLKGTICSSRLKQRQKRVVLGRSCWRLELVAGDATCKGKIENEERSARI